MYYPDIPSVGWSDLRRDERRRSPRYEDIAATYGRTSRSVGDIRRQIIELATVQGVEPPITRHDIKPESRRRHEVVGLGDVALRLIEEHDCAVSLNLDVMRALREEDGAIAESIRAVGQRAFSGPGRRTA